MKILLSALWYCSQRINATPREKWDQLPVTREKKLGVALKGDQMPVTREEKLGAALKCHQLPVTSRQHSALKCHQLPVTREEVTWGCIKM